MEDLEGGGGGAAPLLLTVGARDGRVGGGEGTGREEPVMETALCLGGVGGAAGPSSLGARVGKLGGSARPGRLGAVGRLGRVGAGLREMISESAREERVQSGGDRRSRGLTREEKKESVTSKRSARMSNHVHRTRRSNARSTASRRWRRRSTVHRRVSFSAQGSFAS